MSGRALVTGATGGLGRSLVRALLDQGRTVVATGRNRTIGEELAQAGAHFVPADLARDDLAALCEGADSVFHLAALSAPWGPRRDFETANVVATQRLLDAARVARVPRFIVTSTPSIYTAPRHQIGITEATPLPARPVNHYAATKLAAERLVLATARPGFATVALRPRAIIGPHDQVLLPRLLRAARKGVLPLPGHGRALIEPTDARDVTAALIAAESRAEMVSGRAFNISGGQPVALQELAAHAFGRLGKAVRMIPLPAPLVLHLAGAIEAAAHLGVGGREPPITRYSAMALGWSQTFDLASARTALGFQPRHTPFDAIDWALGYPA